VSEGRKVIFWLHSRACKRKKVVRLSRCPAAPYLVEARGAEVLGLFRRDRCDQHAFLLVARLGGFVRFDCRGRLPPPDMFLGFALLGDPVGNVRPDRRRGLGHAALRDELCVGLLEIGLHG